jgi:lysophospholipase L1-like esterase
MENNNKLDYSNMTLVSFGDSFTFGQGITKDADYVSSIAKKYAPGSAHDARREWKIKSNKYAYTNKLKDILKFKEAINLGLPGASNKRIYSLVRSYCMNNDTSDTFLVINLTSPGRNFISTSYTEEKHKNIMYDFNYTVWNEDKDLKKKNLNIVTNLSKKSVSEFLTEYFNNMTILSDHIITYNALIDFLDKIKVPYVILDIINDTPSVENHYGVLGKLYNDFHYEMNKISGVDLSDYCHIEDYFRNLKETIDTSKYLNYFTIRKHYKTYLGTKIKTEPHLKCLNRYMYTHPLGKHVIQSPVPNDGHWSITGHQVFAELAADWIQKKYGEINE